MKKTKSAASLVTARTIAAAGVEPLVSERLVQLLRTGAIVSPPPDKELEHDVCAYTIEGRPGETDAWRKLINEIPSTSLAELGAEGDVLRVLIGVALRDGALDLVQATARHALRALARHRVHEELGADLASGNLEPISDGSEAA